VTESGHICSINYVTDPIWLLPIDLKRNCLWDLRGLCSTTSVFPVDSPVFTSRTGWPSTHLKTNKNELLVTAKMLGKNIAIWLMWQGYVRECFHETFFLKGEGTRETWFEEWNKITQTLLNQDVGMLIIALDWLTSKYGNRRAGGTLSFEAITTGFKYFLPSTFCFLPFNFLRYNE